MMNRAVSDRYWMRIVKSMSVASTCRVPIATIIVRHNRLMSHGYLGSISGDYHCSYKGCLMVDNNNVFGSSKTGKSCIRTVHSELNAVLKCFERGKPGDWLECYTTYSPCINCFKALLQIGVRKIVYFEDYTDLWRDELINNLHPLIKGKLNMYRIQI